MALAFVPSATRRASSGAGRWLGSGDSKRERAGAGSRCNSRCRARLHRARALVIVYDAGGIMRLQAIKRNGSTLQGSLWSAWGSSKRCAPMPRVPRPLTTGGSASGVRYSDGKRRRELASRRRKQEAGSSTQGSEEERRLRLRARPGLRHRLACVRVTEGSDSLTCCR
jgi:hypothetical protein